LRGAHGEHQCVSLAQIGFPDLRVIANFRRWSGTRRSRHEPAPRYGRQGPNTTLMSCSTIIRVRPSLMRRNQRHRAVGLGAAHAGGRLIEQDDVGAARDRDGDLEARALFRRRSGCRPARHAGRRGRNPPGCDRCAPPTSRGLAGVAPKRRSARPPTIACWHVRFSHTLNAVKDVGDLKAAGQSQAG